jgi:hypothetical protein
MVFPIDSSLHKEKEVAAEGQYAMLMPENSTCFTLNKRALFSESRKNQEASSKNGK